MREGSAGEDHGQLWAGCLPYIKPEGVEAACPSGGDFLILGGAASTLGSSACPWKGQGL